MNTKICSVCNAENYEDTKYCIACGATFLDSANNKVPTGSKKNIIIAAVSVVLVAVAAVGAMFFFGDKKPDTSGDIVFEDSETSETTEKSTTSTTQEKKTEPLIKFTSEAVTNATVTFQVATSHKPTTTTTTTTTTTAAPTTTSRVYTTAAPTTTTAPAVTTTRPSIQIVNPGSEPELGAVELTDDLRYTFNLFINNFVEADMKSFDAFVYEEDILNFAMNFCLINRSDVFEILNSAVEINGQEYNRRIRREDIVESIEDYLQIIVGDDFGEDMSNYSDGYFYALFTGGMLYDKIAVVTGLEYIGDGLYSADFSIYLNMNGNDGMYGYSESQMQAAADSSGGSISYYGTGNAIIAAEDLYDYGTYYLDSYYVG